MKKEIQRRLRAITEKVEECAQNLKTLETDIEEMAPCDQIEEGINLDNYNLIWEDNFEENKEKWNDFTGLHREARNKKGASFVQDGKLIMNAAPDSSGTPVASYIRTWDDQNLEAYNRNEGKNFFLDPTQGDLYIEASVNFENAYQSRGAWWAFWLFGPNTVKNRETGEKWSEKAPCFDPYDGNADTGMEIDIFEYAPHDGARKNGLNTACYVGQEKAEDRIGPDTPDSGYFIDINDYIRNPIDLTKGFHKIGFKWSLDRYDFFIDGQVYWSVTDPRFITKKRANAIVMSWEISAGTFGEPDGNNFQENGIAVKTEIDYVRVYRKK